MANPLKAEFEVFLGVPVTARITFDVIANVERVSGTRLVNAIQQGSLSMTEVQQIVFLAARNRMGGLTLKTVNQYMEDEKNRGLYLKVMEAVVAFFAWFLSAEDVTQGQEGEVAGATSGPGNDS